MLLDLTQIDSPSPRSLPGGLLFGLSVYTSFRWPLPERLLRLHWERLRHDAARMGLAFPWALETTVPVLEKLRSETGSDTSDVVFRLTVASEAAAYGDCFQSDCLPARLLLSRRSLPASREKPLRVRTVVYERPFPMVKTGSMAESIALKRQALAEGYDEILFVNHQGYIREASTANIFMILNHCLWTPEPERDGCLPGIARFQLLEICRTQGIPVDTTASIALNDLSKAEGVFLTNAVQGIMPVDSVNAIVFPWSAPARNMLEKLKALLV